MSVNTYNSLSFSNDSAFADFRERFIKNRAESSLAWFNVEDVFVEKEFNNYWHVSLTTPHFDSIKEEDIKQLSKEYGCALKFERDTHDGLCISRMVSFFCGKIVREYEETHHYQNWELSCVCDNMIDEGAALNKKEIERFFGLEEMWDNEPDPIPEKEEWTTFGVGISNDDLSGADTDGDRDGRWYFEGVPAPEIGWSYRSKVQEFDFNVSLDVCLSGLDRDGDIWKPDPNVVYTGADTDGDCSPW